MDIRVICTRICLQFMSVQDEWRVEMVLSHRSQFLLCRMTVRAADALLRDLLTRDFHDRYHTSYPRFDGLHYRRANFRGSSTTQQADISANQCFAVTISTYEKCYRREAHKKGPRRCIKSTGEKHHCNLYITQRWTMKPCCSMPNMPLVVMPQQ